MTLSEYIKKHLEDMASQDANFKERFEDKAKSLEECEQYIYERAKEEAKGANCVGISDENVLNWAIHYYQEKDVKPKGNVRAKVSTSPSMAPAEKPKAASIQPKPRKAKAKKSESKAVELSLFGDF